MTKIKPLEKNLKINQFNLTYSMKIKENKNQFNPTNERLKYEYSIHKRRIKSRDEKTIIEMLKYLREFEIFIKFDGFEVFDEMMADKYIN